MKFKVPINGHVEYLEDGRMVAPGEEIDLTKAHLDESERDRQLVAEGRLIGASDAAERHAEETAVVVESVTEEGG